MPNMNKKSMRDGVDKAADVITEMAGAKDMSVYWADLMIRKQHPEWDMRVSKQDALASGGNLALTIGSLATGGAVGGAVRGASAAKKAKAAKRAAKEAAGDRRWGAFWKRTYSGHEKEGFRQAAKRNRRK